MLKSSIEDPSIAIKPSSKLFAFIKTLDDPTIDLPKNLLNVYRIFTKDIRKRNVVREPLPNIDYTNDEKSLLNSINADSTNADNLESCLKSLCLNVANEDEDSSSDIESVSAHESDTANSIGKNKAKVNRAKERQKELSKLELNLNDLKWIHQHLAIARQTDESVGYLHDLIGGSQLILPKNVIIERNPELEARCQRLKRQQEEQTYRMMTKNVDCSRSHVPEDTIAYQSMYSIFNGNGKWKAECILIYSHFTV